MTDEWTIDRTIVPGGPGWWSGNSEIEVDGFRVRKRPRAHATEISRQGAQFTLRSAVADIGLGPAVEIEGADLLCNDLRASGYLVGTYSRLRNTPGALDSVIDAHRAVAELPVALPVVDIVDELADLRRIVASPEVAPPSSAAPLERFISSVQDELRDGPLPVPTFSDATAGNAMVRENGSVQLVGGTLAAATDPHYVAGVLIAEFAPHLRSAEEVFERFWGRWDPAAFARAKLFSVADDLRWTYISLIASARNKDPEFLSSLYGQFRAMRGRYAMLDAQIPKGKETA